MRVHGAFLKLLLSLRPELPGSSSKGFFLRFLFVISPDSYHNNQHSYKIVPCNYIVCA